jgi:replicative DNA helicase
MRTLQHHLFVVFDWYIVLQQGDILNCEIRGEHFAAISEIDMIDLGAIWTRARTWSDNKKEWKLIDVWPEAFGAQSELLEAIQSESSPSEQMTKISERCAMQGAARLMAVRQLRVLAEKLEREDMEMDELSGELKSIETLTVDCAADDTRSGDEVLQSIAGELSGKKKVISVPSPEHLRRVYGNWEGNKTYWIGAETSCYKTTFILEAMRIASESHRILFCTLEDDAESVMKRDIVNAGHIDRDQEEITRATLRKTYTQETIPVNFLRAAELISRRNVRIMDKGATWPQLRARIIRAVHRHKIQFVGVDFLQRIQRLPGMDANQHVEMCANGLADLAKELGIPFLIGAQFTSEASRSMQNDQKRRPTCNDFRGGSVIEQAAHAVLLHHVPCKTSPDITLIVGKWKDGMRRDFDIHADGARDKLTERKKPQPLIGGAALKMNDVQWGSKNA